MQNNHRSQYSEAMDHISAQRYAEAKSVVERNLSQPDMPLYWQLKNLVLRIQGGQSNADSVVVSSLVVRYIYASIVPSELTFASGYSASTRYWHPQIRI